MRATWGCSLGWKRVVSSFMALCCRFIFSLPTLPAMNFLSHLVVFGGFFFSQIGLFRVEAVDFGTVRKRKNVARQASSIWKGPGAR